MRRVRRFIFRNFMKYHEERLRGIMDYNRVYRMVCLISTLEKREINLKKERLFKKLLYFYTWGCLNKNLKEFDEDDKGFQLNVKNKYNFSKSEFEVKLKSLVESYERNIIYPYIRKEYKREDEESREEEYKGIDYLGEIKRIDE